MCGILFTNIDISSDIFNKALQTMEYRGPDVNLSLKYGDFQLGHNRLKILDIYDRSNQPFFSHDGMYCIIFNGEIYNFKELQKRFNITTRTTSDTEVLLELYIQLGEQNA